MKVLFDYQIFAMQQYGGISRYFFELIKRFENSENDYLLGTKFTNNAYLNSNTFSNVYPFFPNFNFRGKERFIDLVNKSNTLRYVQKSDFDVFHPTYYDDYFFNNLGDKPYVVTFYDMIHEKFSDSFSDLKSLEKTIMQKSRIAKKAHRIIAISEHTKNDIIDIYNIDKDKIDVVYLGNSLINTEQGEEAIVNDNYLLFVGNRSGYKNFSYFVKTISILLIENKLKLVCGGGGDFSIEELNLLKDLGLQNHVVLIKEINDAILSNLYTNALFFVFPSLYEGFGIPVLESFACNCPTLLSNGGSLPEIGGNGAVYFDLNDDQSLFNAVFNLINDAKLRNELIQQANIRLQNFSWDKTFEDTIKVYEKII
nr:glycosyltransferase family 1 protein [uncultured Flavobacterium sp.]